MKLIANIASALALAFVLVPAARGNELQFISESVSADFAGFSGCDEAKDGSCSQKGSCDGGCGGDCGLGCLSSCCTPAQCWEFGAGAVYLSRSLHPNLVMVRDLDAADTDLLNANDFDLGWAAGPNIYGILHGPGCNGLSFNYYSVDEWSDGITLTPTSGTPPYTLNLVPGTFDEYAANYRSELQSLAINGRRVCSDRLALIAGFRYMQIDEQLGISANGTAGTPNAMGTIDTKNNLYAVQVGADATIIRHGRFALDGLFRVGVANNDNSAVCRISTKTVTFPGSDSASFIGEGIFRGKYCFGDHLSAYGGYQLLWLTNLALAPGQLAGSGGASVVDDDSVFYHGANFGIEFRH